MRTTPLMIAVIITLVGTTACNNSAKDVARQDAALLTNYVDSVERLQPVYTLENWTAIDNGYQERALTAEKNLAVLEAADQAKAEESKKKYAAFKAGYQTKLQENEAAAKAESGTADYRQVLRNRLFGEGKIGSDMKFGFVTAGNILSVYKNFVSAVADNKDNYTREDWDEIKVLYEALDNRKNMVEKNLATADNMKIAGQKVKFASIRATHRGGTKIKENEESKN